ncbi:AraC family transcriptional regulator [Gymnodinialimonas sp. 2305UL16-5]|uniref:helix-turn-helix domain-containing protein n=1 Tax=Gymnodinialimonas mytili TaxID=3126503 RepID=UPI00309D4153
MSALFLIAPTILQSTVFAGLLAESDPRHPVADRVLAYLFAVVALSLLVSLVPETDDSALSAALVLVALPLSLLYGPLTYTYAAALLGPAGAFDTGGSRRVGLWFSVGVALALPVAIVVASGVEGDALAPLAGVFAYTCAIAAIALFLVVNSLYLCRSWRVVWTAGKRGLDGRAVSAASLQLGRRVLLVVSVAWLIALLEDLPEILDFDPVVPPIFGAALDLVCVLAVGWLALAFRRTVGSSEPSQYHRYQRSVLPEEQVERIRKKLDHELAVNRIYLDPNLSLQKLAERVGCPTHKLTHFLNLHLGQTFHDCINKWRIAEACIRLRQSEETVLNISMDVGFNARSTFNAAFAKHMGMTPSDYRQQREAGAKPTPLQ